MLDLKGLKSFLLAEGLAGLLPALSKRPELLQGLIGRLQEIALERIYRNPGNSPAVRDRKYHAARMLFEALRRRVPSYAPAVQKKLAVNMFYNNVHVGGAVRAAYEQAHGEEPPFFFTVSPSMRCDLRCFGCYAAEYAKQGELTREEVIEVIEQGKRELGIYFVVISGGEPTAWPHLLEVIEHHQDVFFQIYTHGMNFSAELVKRFAELGNAYPAISVEGRAEHTDARRGAGAHGKILAAMGRLRDGGVPFGFSVTHTRLNHEAVTSDQFAEEMLAAGATFGWYFQYIPIGRSPDMSLAPTAEQRVARFEAVDRFRTRLPLVIYDFWNDGEATCGCIAWGKRYFHVNAQGDVEPCVFVHFAKDNIREKRLLAIVQSPCFREARSMMPFNADYRFPCSMIDNVDVLPALVRKHGMYPTHAGAERIIGELSAAVRENASRYWQTLCQDPGLVRPAYARPGAVSTCTPGCKVCQK
jgi:MoaA/NifB/PqqE/SkfB family radical SAM enzyme